MLFPSPPAGLEDCFVMLTPENIAVYPPSTLCLHSGGYTPYFRDIPSKKYTQSFFSVAYRLRLAPSESTRLPFKNGGLRETKEPTKIPRQLAWYFCCGYRTKLQLNFLRLFHFPCPFYSGLEFFGVSNRIEPCPSFICQKIINRRNVIK